MGTAVNLPVTGATSALGLSLGALNGAFGIDVAITALEREGKVKILSTPRVTTQNNKLAEVTQGFQIPIQTEQNNTVSVTFKDAALKLAAFLLTKEMQEAIITEIGGFPGVSWDHISDELRKKYADVIPTTIPVFPSGDWETNINDGWYRNVAPNISRT